MRTLRACLLTVLALACGMQADAARLVGGPSARLAANAPQLMIGRLELEWGDPGPQAKAGETPTTQFRATLVDDAGVRRALDADQALAAEWHQHPCTDNRCCIVAAIVEQAVHRHIKCDSDQAGSNTR